MPPHEPTAQVWLSPLQHELLRAREQAAIGKRQRDAQEQRVARLKAKDIHRPLSEQVLETMRAQWSSVR